MQNRARFTIVGLLLAGAIVAAAAYLKSHPKIGCYSHTSNVGWIHSLADLKAKAAEGDAEAQTSLGIFYLGKEGYPTLSVGTNEGRRREANNAEASVWFRKAAEQGDPIAQFNLGRLYFAGKGLRQDAAEALFWALLAEQNKKNVLGVPRCDFPMLREKIELALSPAERASIKKRVREWEAGRVK